MASTDSKVPTVDELMVMHQDTSLAGREKYLKAMEEYLGYNLKKAHEKLAELEKEDAMFSIEKSLAQQREQLSSIETSMRQNRENLQSIKKTMDTTLTHLRAINKVPFWQRWFICY